MSTRDELIAALTSWGVSPEGGLLDTTPLVGGGMLDSLAIFNLTLWVEQQIGSPIDPGSFDISVEWRTIAAVLMFVERARAANGLS